jgi:hypothetical protein
MVSIFAACRVVQYLIRATVQDINGRLSRTDFLLQCIQQNHAHLIPMQDVSDLFGSDLPVEGEPGWCFEWRDGPFLRALRSGHWVILDEVGVVWWCLRLLI